MNSAAQGEKALAESNAPLAIQHYTRALTELPRAPTYYIQRSIAYSRLKPADGGPNSSAALRDAEVALALARERGKRELILSAQMRRAVSLFQLERYGDAQYLFQLVESMTATGEATQNKAEGVKAAMAGPRNMKTDHGAELSIWMLKASRKLRELGEGDEKGIVSVVDHPTDTHVPTEKELKVEWEKLKSGETLAGTSQQTSQQSSGVLPSSAEQKTEAESQAAAKPTIAPVVPEKVRHEWYQSQDSVVVTLYVKGIAKDKVETELKDKSVCGIEFLSTIPFNAKGDMLIHILQASLQFPLASGSEYDFTLDPLFAPINPSTSQVTVMGTKIEIVLQKQTPGQKWSALEASPDTTKLADRPAAPASTPASGPAYPTSSRHGAKDWDKLASNLTSKKSKDKKEEKDDGDDSDGAESVDSEFGGDAVDGFFKKLYSGADPDTRRAMIKSYVESQGTSLSTNWSEVGNKKMEVHPPN
ncbi:uncharacterized protein N7459_008282 [Penicillium hispanicum]|uniref:uncharacterized protein n=1 Tax=Penicillium hispanicum TaxID=1080232 RepID=UPI0025422683|nr:uncharacterized protein N7459_008282 [Penicillium hispanicum]KAJ5573855.1 hypothetical protein N7459_008282 [Penicillium hispanicum]